MLIPCSFGHSLPVGGPLDLPRLKRQDEDAKTGLDSMYDAHVVASSFSSLPATHRLVFYLILDMVDTTQAHSHVRGAPLEQQRIGITGTGRQRVAHGELFGERPL